MQAANKVHKSAVAVIPSFGVTQTVQKLRCFRDKSFLVGTVQQQAGSQQHSSSSSMPSERVPVTCSLLSNSRLAERIQTFKTLL
jgi:hypothetical protein